eukprot:11946805-Alexandrium_andersonii.AAC.1
MNGIAVLLTDIARGLRAYGAPMVVAAMRAYLVCVLAEMFMARRGFNPEGNVGAKSNSQAAFWSRCTSRRCPGCRGRRSAS